MLATFQGTLLFWYFDLILFNLSTLQILHGIFMAMIRIALVRLMGFMSL